MDGGGGSVSLLDTVFSSGRGEVEGIGGRTYSGVFPWGFDVARLDLGAGRERSRVMMRRTISTSLGRQTVGCSARGMDWYAHRCCEGLEHWRELHCSGG